MQAMYYETYFIHLKYFLPQAHIIQLVLEKTTRKHFVAFWQKKQISLKPTIVFICRSNLT